MDGDCFVCDHPYSSHGPEGCGFTRGNGRVCTCDVRQVGAQYEAGGKEQEVAESVVPMTAYISPGQRCGITWGECPSKPGWTHACVIFLANKHVSHLCACGASDRAPNGAEHRRQLH